MPEVKTILAIDPGTEKCGLALVSNKNVILQKVIARSQLISEIKDLLPKDGIIVLGDRTGSDKFWDELLDNLPNIDNRVVKVDEHLSSVEARKRYWQKNRPKGWRRMVPTSMQVPPAPIDDYVAVILAERFLQIK